MAGCMTAIQRLYELVDLRGGRYLGNGVFH